MPLSRRPMAWLTSLVVLMNLFVMPLSQAPTTQERASLLLGGFCSTSSDSLLRRRRRYAQTGRLLVGIAAGTAGQPGP